MDIAAAISLLLSGKHEKYPLASESDCTTTESAIGHHLPPSFRTFVNTFSNGAYLYSAQEVCSVGSGNPQIAPIQDALCGIPGLSADESISYRKGGEVKVRQLVPFSLDSNGNAWCFIFEDTSADECPVAYLDTTGRKLYGKLPSFTAWLELLAKNQSEVIRCLYDEDVILDELELG